MHNKVPHSNENEWTTITLNLMEEFDEHILTWKKLGWENMCMLFKSMCLEFIDRHANMPYVEW